VIPARIVLLLLAAPAAVAAQTSPVCPWYTTGSAERMLGGQVMLIAHVNGTYDGSCMFARGTGPSAPAIEIVIGKANLHPCPDSSTKVSALGNEAVQCRRELQGSQVVTIAGRMRDVYFSVSMMNVSGATDEQPADPHLSPEYGASPLERVAEQVVGNLY
jgi:hypothetical protein